MGETNVREIDRQFRLITGSLRGRRETISGGDRTGGRSRLEDELLIQR